MDLKVLKEGPVSSSSAVQPKSAARKPLDVGTADVGVSTEPLQPTTLSNKVLQKHAEPAAHINLNKQSVALSSQSNQGEFSAAGNVVEMRPLPTEPESVLNQPTNAGTKSSM